MASDVDWEAVAGDVWDALRPGEQPPEWTEWVGPLPVEEDDPKRDWRNGF